MRQLTRSKPKARAMILDRYSEYEILSFDLLRTTGGGSVLYSAHAELCRSDTPS